MAIKARQMLVKESKYKIKCPYVMTAKYITVHNTANDASANNEVQYMINSINQVSYHFAVDDKEVVQGIPLNRNAWHAGDGNGPGNRSSIGIEICYSKSGGTKYYQAEGLAIQFIAQLLRERGWGIDRVKKHQDWSGKYCPHRILSEGRWNSFLKAIENEMKPKTKKKVSGMKPNWADWQWKEAAETFKKAREKGILSSDQWEKKAVAKDLTFDEIEYLNLVLNGRVL